MRKVAVFSDIHGNLTALNAVYQDAQQLKATDYWFLGDLFGPGPATQKLWARLATIDPSVKLRGNWEDFFLDPQHQSPNLQIKMIETHVANHLMAVDQIKHEISDWPLHQEVVVNGIKFGLSHNLPSTNTGDTLSPRAEASSLSELFKGNRQDCDVVIYAHIHHPTMRYVDLYGLKHSSGNYDYAKADERLVLNVGSVGLPFDRPTRNYYENRAEYLLLEIGDHGEMTPNFRKVNYDHQLEVDEAHKRQLPFLDQWTRQMHLQ